MYAATKLDLGDVITFCWLYIYGFSSPDQLSTLREEREGLQPT